MEKILIICFVVSVLGAAFPEKTESPRSIYPQSALVGWGVGLCFLFWGYESGAIFLGILAAVLRLLVCVPFRFYMLLVCEVGSAFWWRWWALEQIVQAAVLLIVLNYAI